MPWELKTNMRGPAGLPATDAAEDDAAIADFMERGPKTTAALAGVVSVAGRDLLAPLALFHKALQARRATQPIAIAFCGDSYTFGHTTAYAKRWVTMFAAKFSGAGAGTLDTPAPLPNGLQIINAAENGMRSTNYLDAVKTAKLIALQPTLIVHMIGANDWTNAISPAQTTANLRAKIKELDAGITVPHVHLLLLGHERWDARVVGTPWTWAQYGVGMRQISDEMPASVAFADLSQHFGALGVPGKDPFSLGFGDSVHVNDAGHAEYLDLLAEIINPAMPALVASDSFDRSILGSTETGALPWTAAGGSVVVSNGAMTLGAPASAQLGTMATVPTPRNGIYTIELAAGTIDTGIVFGLNAAKTQGYAVFFRGGATNRWRLTTYNAAYDGTTYINAFNNILAESATSTAGRTITVSVSAGRITVVADGIEVLRFTDSLNYAGGTAGVFTASSSGTAAVTYWEKKASA